MKGVAAFCAVLALSAVFLLPALAPWAGALGISTPYLEDNTLLVPEGSSSAFFTITLQNVDKEVISARVGYSSDGDIAKIIDYRETYVLQAGSIDNKLTFNITLPEGAKIGSVYQVRFSVTPLKAQSGGIISMITGVGRDFKVKVVKNPDKFYLGHYLAERGLMWAILVSIAVAYVMYGVYKRKNKRNKRL